MPTIADARLAITLNLPANTAQVSVTANVRFSQLEQFFMKNGLRFRLDCKIWGEDLGWWLDPDDFLFNLPSRFFPDATPTAIEAVKLDATVPKNVLNEDSGTDEIYGELILKNLENGSKTKKRTNVIKQQFG